MRVDSFYVLCTVFLLGAFFQGILRAQEMTTITENSGNTPDLGGNLLREKLDHRNTFFQKITADQFYTYSGGQDQLNVLHAGISAMFAVHCFGNFGAFLFSPTGTYDHFSTHSESLGKEKEDFYRLGMNFTWMYEPNDFWRVFLFVTPSYAGDLHTTNSQTLRVPGGGLAIWTPSPNWQFSLGAYYTTMNWWPVMPLGGVTWQPSEDWKFEITFPKPRICHQVQTPCPALGPLWLYVAAEYTGGSWGVELDENRSDALCYSEWRIVLGAERAKPKIGQLNFSAEIGVSFARRLYFNDDPREFNPNAGLVEKIQLSF